MRKVAIVTNQIPDFRYPVFRRLMADPALQLRIFLSAPLARSSANARAHLPLVASKTFRFRFTIHHREVDTVQHDEFGIPVALWRDLLKFRPDAIVTGDYGLRSVLCLGVARLLKIPVVLWSEETTYSARGRTRLQHWVRRFLSRRVDAFLAWGRPASDYVESLGVERQRLYRCHQAVDNEFWMSRAATLNRTQERSTFGFDDKVFLLVGQLIPRKGIVNFLDAWDRMPDEAKSVARAVIVGDGELAQMLRELVTTRGLTNVTFVGPLPPTELVRYYVAADVFVFPSLEDVWGMVVNEALCCGLPVLASKFAGASQELVAGRNVGEIVDPTDIAAFSRHLCEWALRPPAIPINACRDVVAPLNAEESSNAIAGMLQSLLGSPRAAPA